MIDPTQNPAALAELEQLLHDRTGARGRGLAAKLRRAGRRLPRHARRAGQRITAAHDLLQHPKLARLVDHAQTEHDIAMLRSTLKDIDPKERRKDAILSVLGSAVFNLMLLGALIAGLLWWQSVI